MVPPDTPYRHTQMPSWQSAFFARLTRISGLRSFGADAGIDELRQHYDRLTARFGAVPPDATFEPAQLGPVKGEWVRVEGAARHRLVLYFHGGGHIAGSPAGHRPLVARLCQAGGAHGFSLAYRLAPGGAFPLAGGGGPGRPRPPRLMGPRDARAGRG